MSVRVLIYASCSALDFHTSNVALLQICGGIAGSIEKCEGSPTSTVGQSGNVHFTITPVVKGDTINISKGRWEREFLPFPFAGMCVGRGADARIHLCIEGIKAAFAVCGQNIPFTATFTGGATKGDVNVTYGSV